MVFVGFLWAGAMIALWLIVFTVVAYAFPNSLIGKTLAIIK
jgi:hypothetical protein